VSLALIIAKILPDQKSRDEDSGSFPRIICVIGEICGFIFGVYAGPPTPDTLFNAAANGDPNRTNGP
jgi:hypothetical protein